MRKLTFFLLFWAFTTLSISAQDWALLTHNSKLNMRLNGGTYITTTLLVNNAMAQGTDSVFLLSPRKPVYLSYYPHLGFVGNILGDSLIKRSNGVYECRFIPPVEFSYPQNTCTIRTKAEVGDTWAFQTGVTATVTGKIDTVCWGYPDSIKTIGLSDGKKIRLSKRFGLFYFGDQALIGLDGQNIGQQLPKRSDFYADWQMDAVFEYSLASTSNFTNATKSWLKYKVINQELGADTIKICVRKLVKSEKYTNSQLISTTYFDTIETLIVLNPNLVSYPRIYKDPFSPIVSTGYTPTADGLKLSINNVITPSSGGPNSELSFVLGIGQTYKRFAFSDISYSFSEESKQIGYQKAGQIEHGMIHPDSFFGVVNNTEEEEEEDKSFKLSIFPNPVSGGIIHLTCNNCTQIQSLDLMTMTGQVVHAVTYPAPRHQIDVQTLGTGIYLLRLQFSDGTKMMKKVMIR
jgi:Secretion system C-terminal sorting domain